MTLRGLRRDRPFTATAIAMLALGLAVNATAFTIMDAMVFRGLPGTRQGDRIVYVDVRRPSGYRASISPSDFDAWRSQTRAFEGLAFVTGAGPGPTTVAIGNRHPVEVMAQRISANTFSLLGVRPMLGRDFEPADELPGALPVVILSFGFWEGRLGKNPDVVGSTIRINGTASTVVGITPKRFVLVYEQDLWMPRRRSRDAGGDVFGRLRDGVTLEEARADLDTINRQLAAADPATDRRVVLDVETYSQAHVGREARTTYGSLWAGGWFILLIVCANAANLTLARTLRQWRQLSVKIALGASQWRMAGHVFTESVALVSVASVLAWWTTKWAVARWAIATSSRYLALDYTVDSSTLLYLVEISFVTAVLCSVAPLWMIARSARGAGLRIEAGGLTPGRQSKRLRRLLMPARWRCQSCCSAVRACSLEAFSRSSTPKRVCVMPNVCSWDRCGFRRMPYATADARIAYFTRLRGELRTVAGISDVSFASHIPVNWVPDAEFEIEGQTAKPDRDSAQFLSTGSSYFRVIGAPPLVGREFTDADQPSAQPVAIVNQRFADRFLRGEHAIGWRLRRIVRNEPGEWLTVVGIVPNVIQVPSGNDQTRQQFTPLIYLPFRQSPLVRAVSNAGRTFPGQNVLLRISVRPDLVTDAILATVRRTDPDASLEELKTLSVNVAFDRDRMDITHAELGAAAADVRRMVVRDGMYPVVPGTLAGLALSLWMNRLLESQLVGVAPSRRTTR